MLMQPKPSFDKFVIIWGGKRWNQINLDLFRSVASFLRFKLNFQLVNISQYKIWQLWKWFICYFCFQICYNLSHSQVGKRWNQINFDLFTSVASFLRFKLNFQLVKIYQYKIWQLWKWLICYFCFCEIFWIAIYC